MTAVTSRDGCDGRVHPTRGHASALPGGTIRAAYRRPMRENRLPPVPNATESPTARVQRLHLVAAARVAAVRPTSEQQVADIVRVTVDDEVDTRTFKAIVADLATAVGR
jgi:hypothetical protein